MALNTRARSGKSPSSIDALPAISSVLAATNQAEQTLDRLADLEALLRAMQALSDDPNHVARLSHIALMLTSIWGAEALNQQDAVALS